MPDALRLNGVRAGYGETVVLEDIAFGLQERGSLAVLGRNGVGKTTLLSTVMGHTSFHAGRIELQGRPIEALPPYERSRLGIGYVPQEREIFPSLTVEENLTVAARPCTTGSLASPRGAPTWATRFQAASSRCSPSAAP